MNAILTSDELLQRLQSNRRLTRAVIEAFPEDKLFTYSIGGMRTFGAMVMEFLGMEIPIVEGVATGEWKSRTLDPVTSKAEVLKLWDADTEKLNELWQQIPAERFTATDTAFGKYTGTGVTFFFYALQNEIHHRGQAYVYLRSLGIEPPSFVLSW